MLSHRGKITELELESGKRRDLVTNLPSLGDHPNGDLIFGPDGLIFRAGHCYKCRGVVGSDNFVYAWTDRYPDFRRSFPGLHLDWGRDILPLT